MRSVADSLRSDLLARVAAMSVPERVSLMLELGRRDVATYVRISNEAVAIDVVVGRHAWQEQVLARAAHKPLANWEAPVVTKPDLVLLKLFAGAAQDKWDIEALLAGGAALAASVSANVGVLPERRSTSGTR